MADALKLDDILSCPVCYEVFKPGLKILQCLSGHAICENCHQKLQSCPVCKEMFSGTRNFVMEEMVKKLRRLSTGALMSLDDDVTEGVVMEIESQSENEVGNNEESAKILKKKEERKAKKKEKMKLKKQLKQQSGESSSVVTVVQEGNSSLVQSTPSTSTNHAKPDAKTSLENKRKKTQIRQALEINAPPQPRGLFPCPTNDKNDSERQCQSKIPFCRLYNHLRSLHKNRLYETETVINANKLIATCSLEIPVPVADYRHVIKVKEFGLFVLVFSAEREMFGEECTVNRVTGFVKMVGTVSAAKHFNYNLEVAIGKYVASCSDMCHYSFTEEANILLSDQCLTLKVSKLSRFARIKLEIMKNTGSRTRQPITTNVQIIPNFGSSNHQGEISTQRKQHKKAKKH